MLGGGDFLREDVERTKFGACSKDHGESVEWGGGVQMHATRPHSCALRLLGINRDPGGVDFVH